jgi:hypothetical protein
VPLILPIFLEVLIPAVHVAQLTVTTVISQRKLCFAKSTIVVLLSMHCAIAFLNEAGPPAEVTGFQAQLDRKLGFSFRFLTTSKTLLFQKTHVGGLRTC